MVCGLVDSKSPLYVFLYKKYRAFSFGNYNVLKVSKKLREFLIFERFIEYQETILNEKSFSSLLAVCHRDSVSV